MELRFFQERWRSENYVTELCNSLYTELQSRTVKFRSGMSFVF